MLLTSIQGRDHPQGETGREWKIRNIEFKSTSQLARDFAIGPLCRGSKLNAFYLIADHDSLCAPIGSFQEGRISLLNAYLSVS